jgi:hypothetical protein
VFCVHTVHPSVPCELPPGRILERLLKKWKKEKKDQMGSWKDYTYTYTKTYTNTHTNTPFQSRGNTSLMGAWKDLATVTCHSFYFYFIFK